MFKEHCFLRFPDFGPSDGRYDVTRLLCARLSQLRQSPRRDPASAVLSNDASIRANDRDWNELCGRPPVPIGQRERISFQEGPNTTARETWPSAAQGLPLL